MAVPELPIITVGFSSHRSEALPLAKEKMVLHDAIALEEAPEPDFPELLNGKISVADYLEEKDVEFPEFSQGQLEMLRELHGQGKAIFQVEPYLEKLIRIHELLADGRPPEEVESRPELREVYAVERLTTGALLAFYTAAHTGPFPRVVAAVKDFARADAVRFRLRDELRAVALSSLVGTFSRLYVEAGHIHLYLIRALRRRLAGRARLRPVFLMAFRALPALKNPPPLGPGDLLTLRHVFGLATAPHREDLLAARSLIYIKLLQKTEMAPGADPTPDLTDEIRASRLVSPLSWGDCAVLYPRVRQAAPAEAVALVAKYVKGGG